MLIYYDFGAFTEAVADTTPSFGSSPVIDAGSAPLGRYLCMVLSVDYKALAKSISQYLVCSYDLSQKFPKEYVIDILNNTFGGIGFAEKEDLCKRLDNTYHYAVKDKDFFPRLSRLGQTFESWLAALVYQVFAKVVVSQSYLECCETNAEMLSHIKFERFIDAVYSDGASQPYRIVKQDTALSFSEYSIDDNHVFPDDDIAEQVLDVFNELESISIKYIALPFDRISDFVISSIYYIFQHGHRIKRCKNCGRFFIPFNRSDELYCNNQSPQDPTMTCKEYGNKKLWYDKMKQDEIAALANRIKQRLAMKARRNPDIKTYQDTLDKFRTGKKEWEQAIKRGERSRDDYKTWLLEMDNRKY